MVVTVGLQCLGTVGPWTVGFGRVGGSLNTYLGGSGGDAGGTAVDIPASSRASMATWYGVHERWGLRGGLVGGGGGVRAWMDGGGEGRVINIGG